MQSDLYQRLGRELPRSAFTAQHNYPFLVFGKIGASAEDDEWSVEFDTGQMRTQPPPSRQDIRATAAFPTLTSFLSSQGQFGGILPVTKSERNPYAGRISVGRAASCDIVVPVLHVSKLHAHFLRSDDGGWEIRDAKSTNGTFVNARRSAPGVLVPLKPGDTLLFGALSARFLDASALFDLVNRAR